MAEAGKLDYFRVNPSLTMDIYNATDDISEPNINVLKTYAHKAITNDKEYSSFVEMMQTLQSSKNHYDRKDMVFGFENAATPSYLSSEPEYSSADDE